MSELAALLPPDVSGAVFAALIAASFAGSFVTAAFGIGGGALLLAIMASLVSPAALIPVHGAIQLSSNAVRAGMLFSRIVWRALPWFLAGTLIGIAAGGSVVVALPASWVQFGVGVFIVWSVFAKPPAWLRRWPLVTGLVSSFLTMFFGATGPFVAGYVKALALDRHQHVATHAALMTSQHLAKVAVFGFLGFAFAPWALVVVGMIAAGVAGTFSGRLVLDRLSEVDFRRLLDAVLLLLAARLIWTALSV